MVKKIGIVLVAILLGLSIFFLVKASQVKEPVKTFNPDNITVMSVPEQKESQVHPDFVIEPVVEELPAGTNIAVDKPIDASSYQDVYTPTNANDGIVKGKSYWEGKDGTYPNTLTVDLEQSESFYAMRICVNPQSVWGKRTQIFSVKTSEDGTNYETLVEENSYPMDPNTGNQIIIYVDETQARYVQLEFTANTGAVGGQVAEFEIYQK